MSFDKDTAAALASALPLEIDVYDIGELSAYLADRLAESGYVLLHGKHMDDATLERVAKTMYEFPPLDQMPPWPHAPSDIKKLYRREARAVLAALAAPRADEPAEVDRG